MSHRLRFAFLSRRLAGTVALCLFMLLAAGAPAVAQMAQQLGASGENEARAPDQALEDLIVTLESETGREKLVEQLKAVLEARRQSEDDAAAGEPEQSPGSQLLDGDALLHAVTRRVRGVGEQLVQSSQIIARAPELIPWVERQIGDSQARAVWVASFLKIVGVLLAAIVAELIAVWLLSRPRRALEARAGDAWEIRAAVLVMRSILDLVPIAVFALTAEVALSWLEPQQATAEAARALILANVLARSVMVFARFVFVPKVARLRLLDISDETANYGYVWVRRFANVGLYGAFGINAGLVLGMALAVGSVLQQILALVLTGMAIALILQLRETIRDWIAGRADEVGSALRARLADVWHVAAILYVVALFCIWLLDISGGFMTIARATAITLIAIIVARLADVGADRLLGSIFSLRQETRERFPGLEARAGRYLPVVYGMVRTLIWFVAAMITAEAWGLDAFGWLGSPSGRAVLGAVAQIIIVGALAVMVLELVSSAIERYLRRSQEAGNSSARMQTLLPLMRNVLRVTVSLVATLIVLSEIGINIGPLLAGAGVAGLAIGFGAQKLVQDVINGMFIIIENTVSIGDVVNVAGHIGLCEAITIRTITLRDLSGTVHTVPFNEVTTIENLTKDYSFALLNVGVAYREDTDAVIEILHGIDDEMRGEDEYGSVMLEPLEVLGVDEFADSAVIIKVRIKTQPIKQWMIKREFNRRMKKAFDAAGIEIPFPHTTLYFGEDKQGNAPPAQVLLKERQLAESGESGAEDPQSAAEEAGESSPQQDRKGPTADLPE